MHMALTIRRSLSLGVALLIIGCQHTRAPDPPPLASHPSWEMFPRASSPPATCPGQYRTTIEESTGTIFLGCWGHKTD